MRREACPRSCSTLRSNSPLSRLRADVYVWFSRTPTHTRIYGRERTRGRLVPPRLRRASHLLTEYHRDSYMATVCWMHAR